MSDEPQGGGDAPETPPSTPQAFHIFVNYRREDTAGHAGRLYDALSERFGDDHVFIDIDAIHPGEDFTQAVEASVGSCDVLLALIGRHWIDVKDSEGRRRIEKPHDWVSLEIQTALARAETRVIPTLVQGAEMPGPDELPGPLRKLSVHNAVELSDTRWHSDVSHLIEYLQQLAGPRATPAPAQQPGAPAAAGADEPKRTRARWIVPLVAVAVLAVAAVAAVVALTGGGDAKDPAEAAYVRQTDSLLSHSAETKGNLGAVIQRVENNSITRDKALSTIDRIIGERDTLARSLPVDTPPAFEHAQELLRKSIQASLRDDEAVRLWIVAVFGGTGDAPARRAKFQQLSATAKSLKDQFRAEYNSLRNERLGLEQTNPDF